MPDPRDDQKLHDLVRERLRARAAEADTSPQVLTRVAPSARARRALWVAGGAALAVAATVVAVALAGGRVAPPDADPPPAGESQEPGKVPADWRSESWQGLTVSVPPDWGYDGAPVDRRTICARGPDGPGYVGRPVYLTDACETYEPGNFPLGRRLPFVWLGAPVEPGRLELGSGGWVQETVTAFGTTLTVASDDAVLREQILDSARATDLCSAELPGTPEPSQTLSTEGLVGFAPDRLSVCAYRREGGAAAPIALSYAADLDDRAAAAYAPIAGGARERLRCASSEEAVEWVVLLFEGDDPFGTGRMFHEVVVHLGGAGCPRVQLDPGTALALSPELVEPWATGGIPAVVYGPTGGKGAMIDSFIGPQG